MRSRSWATLPAWEAVCSASLFFAARPSCALTWPGQPATSLQKEQPRKNCVQVLPASNPFTSPPTFPRFFPFPWFPRFGLPAHHRLRPIRSAPTARLRAIFHFWRTCSPLPSLGAAFRISPFQLAPSVINHRSTPRGFDGLACLYFTLPRRASRIRLHDSRYCGFVKLILSDDQRRRPNSPIGCAI